jgi:hypothetical protein
MIPAMSNHCKNTSYFKAQQTHHYRRTSYRSSDHQPQQLFLPDVQLERHLNQSSHRLNARLKEVFDVICRSCYQTDSGTGCYSKSGRLWVVSWPK